LRIPGVGVGLLTDPETPECGPGRSPAPTSRAHPTLREHTLPHRSSVFGTWVPITHYGVGADLPVGPSERASARRVGQEADPYKSGRTSKNGAPALPRLAVDAVLQLWYTPLAYLITGRNRSHG